MTDNDQYPVELQQIEQSLNVLQRRKRNLTASAVFGSSVGIASFVCIFFQQELIFNLFGVAQQIQYIHLPFTINTQLRDYIHQPDFLVNAFSWLGWLILKLMLSFIGAFVVVSFLKKIYFFKIRLQSFLLKFVAWMCAFILLWSGIAYVQHDMRDDEESEILSFIQYDKGIQQSEIYQYLSQSKLPDTMQSYLLAQTALLHKPTDQVVATVYAEKLMKAEQSDPKFLEYGFKPEQLWSIQHQVFNKALTPIAQSVEKQVIHATFWSNFVEKGLWILTIISLSISLILYLLSNRIGKRLNRVRLKLGG